MSQNGKAAVFTCNATGHPPPMIIWYTPAGVTTVSDKNMLTVVSEAAGGVYQCFVTNNIGCDHSELFLNVSNTSGSTIADVDASLISYAPSTLVSSFVSSNSAGITASAADSSIMATATIIAPTTTTITTTTITTTTITITTTATTSNSTLSAGGLLSY